MAQLTILAKGFKPLFSASSFSIKITAAAPSFIPEELPAVTVPFFLNAGFNLDSPSIEVCGLINSTEPNNMESAFRCGISTFTINF